MITRVLMSLFMICFFASSCASKDITIDTDVKDLRNLVGTINSKHYHISSMGVRKLFFECESDVINYAVSQIKDDVLRNQLRDTKFTIEWDPERGFIANVIDIPTLEDPVSNEKLMGVLMRGKDRMLASFNMVSFLFNGISNSDLSRAKGISTKGKYKTLVLQGPSDRVVEIFYFNENARLEMAELLDGKNKISEIKYQFEEKNSVYYLKQISIFYPKTSSRVEMAIDYAEFNGMKLPSIFNGKTVMADNTLKDVIRVIEAKSN